MDTPCLVLGVADHDRTDPCRPLDLRRVAPDGLAMLEKDRLLALDGIDATSDVVRVAVPCDQPEGDLLAAPPMSSGRCAWTGGGSLRTSVVASCGPLADGRSPWNMRA